MADTIYYEYWRGSTWININYFIIKGLIKYGDRFMREYKPKIAKEFYDTAKKLAWKSIDETSYGYYEYYSSNKQPGKQGKIGLGADNFTWSGLILNILSCTEKRTSFHI